MHTSLTVPGPLRVVTTPPSREAIDRALRAATRGLRVDPETFVAWIAKTPGALRDFVERPEFARACAESYATKARRTWTDTGGTVHGVRCGVEVEEPPP